MVLKVAIAEEKVTVNSEVPLSVEATSNGDQRVVKGSDLDQWKTDAKQTILWPEQYATGTMRYPYTEARKGSAPENGKAGSSAK